MEKVKGFCKVLRNQPVAKDCYDMIFEHTEMARLASAGQFVHIVCGNKTLRRPISICEIDKQAGTIRMLYQVKGEGTQWLSDVSVGDEIDVLGPLGHGFDIVSCENPIVVGGGIGCPPMLETAKAFGGKAEAILGFRSADFAILQDDFNNACKAVNITTDDGSLGHHGFVTDVLKERLEEGRCDLILACGPRVMLKNIAALAEQYGVRCQVSMEERMGCGVGACLVCNCKTKLGDNERYVQVCRYGPVMDSKEVVW
jgi:dihydroorotate dehydrogenase electron transfer subunit